MGMFGWYITICMAVFFDLLTNRHCSRNFDQNVFFAQIEKTVDGMIPRDVMQRAVALTCMITVSVASAKQSIKLRCKRFSFPHHHIRQVFPQQSYPIVCTFGMFSNVPPELISQLSPSSRSYLRFVSQHVVWLL